MFLFGGRKKVVVGDGGCGERLLGKAVGDRRIFSVNGRKAKPIPPFIK